jgi:hypothetical protein
MMNDWNIILRSRLNLVLEKTVESCIDFYLLNIARHRFRKLGSNRQQYQVKS